MFSARGGGGAAKKDKLSQLEDQAGSKAEELQSAKAEIQGRKLDVAARQQERDRKREELAAASARASELRACGAGLSADLERARSQLGAEKAELVESTRGLEDLKGEVAELQGKLRKVKQLHEVLQLANSHMTPVGALGPKCPPAFQAAGGVHEIEGQTQDAMQAELYRVVAEAVEIEVETKVWENDEEKQRISIQEVTADCRALTDQRANVLVAIEAAEAENLGLASQVASAKERVEAARRELDSRKKVQTDMADAIVLQNTSMSALKFQYRREVGSLLPRIQQSAEQRQQVESASLKRLTDMKTATRDHRRAAAAAAAEATAAVARQAAATPPSSLPVELSRPTSARRSLTAEAAEGVATPSGTRPPSAGRHDDTPRAMLAPVVDLRLPELRGSHGGAPMSARLGHAGRLVVG